MSGRGTTGRAGDWPALGAWREALAARDGDAAVRLAAPDVRLGGPRGVAEGAETLRRWVAGSGIRLAPVAWHPVAPDAAVVEEDATWPGRPDVDPAAPPVRVFTAYALKDGRLRAVLRHDALADALAAAGGLAAGA